MQLDMFASSAPVIEQRRIRARQAVALHAPQADYPQAKPGESLVAVYDSGKYTVVAPPAEPVAGAVTAEPPKPTEWQQRVEKMLTAIASGATVKGDVDDILRAIDESGLVVIGLVWPDNAPIPTLYV